MTHHQRKKRRPKAPPALIDGLPPAAWIAALEATEDPEALRLMLKELFLHVGALRVAALKQGVKLPRLYAPSKAILKSTRKRGLK